MAAFSKRDYVILTQSGHLQCLSLFNLKLPMKQRRAAVDGALNGIRNWTRKASTTVQAKQLYHDREEVTVFLVRTKG